MKIIFKSVLLLCTICLASLNCSAQEYLKEFLNHLTPLSPEAASIQKFGNMPSDLNTGTPIINVPVYSYTNKDLNLNVNLNYSAGGVKVDEIASSVGIGWSLEAGGIISRSVRGTYDELNLNGFLNSSSLPSSELLGNRPISEYDRPFNKMHQNRLDSQNDVFSYSFGGSSGLFYLGKNNDIIVAPQRKIKIEKTIATIEGKQLISKFEITDETGRKFIFEAFEVSTIHSGSENSTYTSSWYLTQIVSSNLMDKIIITYSDVTLNSFDSYRTSSERRLAITGGGLISSTQLVSQSIRAKRIAQINFPNGIKVDFIYNTSNRVDLPGDKSLVKIAVTDPNLGERGAILTQDNSLNRLTLKSVLKYGKNSTVVEKPYEFTYHSPLPAKLSFQQDHWGYYNSNGVNNLIPAETFNGHVGGLSSLPGGNREVDPIRCLAGSMTKIIYPSGGSTVFEFGPNIANHDWHLKNQGYVGGIRINRMLDYDTVSATPVSIKVYEYLLNDGTTSSGEIGIYPLYSQAVYYEAADPFLEMNHVYSSQTPNYIIRSNSTVDNLVYLKGSPVSYSRVIEKIYGNSTGNYKGKIVRTYSPLSVSRSAYFPQVPQVLQSWNSGLLLSEMVYNAQEKLVRKSENTYNHIDDNFYSNSTRRENFRNQVISPVMFRSSSTSPQIDPNGSPVYFVMSEFFPYSGRTHLIKEVNTEYDPLGLEVVSTVKSSGFDGNYYYKICDTLKDSKSSLLITKYKYNPDLSLLAGTQYDVYREMVGKNIINRPVETLVSRGSIPIHYQSLEYSKNILGYYFVNNIKEGKTTASISSSYSFQSHDSYGNPREVRSLGMPVTVYLWGYGGHYPIAKIENSTYAEVIGALGSNATTILNSLNSSTVSDATIDTHMTTLRNSLKNARVTSYTYGALVGMTSMTDPRGNKESYQYDGFQRLKSVLDFSNNILKNYQYNYRTN
ncbi:Uncharacterised protein [Sphingobacterium mizutaii]|uniref:YD repeat-containing protein n=2 Tax=Sphingobacterium mizutaii TaxID=1010 RepID=A0AAJ4X993_9SPHI|nr:hypothetical protein [Sphingobacterium mizutaii]SDL85229.1 YD repeat-containing protein [Sphingobacterium mizutaii]SNV36787.1 Uncharacterised protein [Sphingobacterium mizutaii]